MLVSAIMPTADRRHLLPIAIGSFLSQDWPEKELIVIDDGKEPVRDLFSEVETLAYVYSENKRTIGAKLNQACEMAAGKVLIRWDDDDWSNTGRITDQVNRMLESGKNVSGYHSMLFWSVDARQLRKYSGPRDYALGTSLCFTRDYWNSNRFGDSSNGEDLAFIRLARKAGSIVSVYAETRMIALTHPMNTGSRSGVSAWPLVDPREIPAGFLEAIQ